MRGLAEAMEGEGGVPIWCKIRLHPDLKDTIEFVQMLQVRVRVRHDRVCADAAGGSQHACTHTCTRTEKANSLLA